MSETYYSKILQELNTTYQNSMSSYDFYRNKFILPVKQAANRDQLFIEFRDDAGEVFLTTRGKKGCSEVKNLFDNRTQYFITDMSVSIEWSFKVVFTVSKEDVVNKDIIPTKMLLLYDPEEQGDYPVLVDAHPDGVPTSAISVSDFRKSILHSTAYQDVSFRYILPQEVFETLLLANSNPITMLGKEISEKYGIDASIDALVNKDVNSSKESFSWF